MLTLLAGVALLAWLYLLLLHGAFWTAEPQLDPEPDPPAPSRGWPPVVAVVPARNEAGVIEGALRSLRRQSYPGSFSVVVVDDNSDDGTAKVARESEGDGTHGVKVIRGAPPREGWAGKVWAMAQGVEWARSMSPAPEYLWFTDADIEHDANVLRSLVSKAEDERRDLVSTLVQLRCESLWEKLLVPPFVFFFMKLYPFRRANRDESGVAAAAGGSMLTRRQALEDAGGLEEIRDRLIDDCALARLIKESGSIWIGLTRASRSIRGYTFRSGWNMVARSAFTQLRYSWVLLALAVVGMAVLYLVPPLAALWGGVGAFSGSLAALGGAGPGVTVEPAVGGLVQRLGSSPGAALGLGLSAWSLMALSFGPTLRFFGLGAFWATTLPGSAFLYMLMTLHSAFRHLVGRGGLWKGRAHAPTGRSSPKR